MLVLGPKGNGEFRSIGLVYVLWKTLLGFINWRIGAALHFHNVLHDFREGWEIGTAYLKAKILQQLMSMREEVLYDILLYLHRSYDATYCIR